MKRLLINIVFLFTPILNGFSQDNVQIQFGYRGSVAAAKLLPSTHMLKKDKYEFSLQYSFWLANKSITYGSIRKVYKQNYLTREDVNQIVNDLDEDNKIGVGQDFMVFGLGYKSIIKERPVLWSFTISDRLNANTFIPKSLVQLAWQGNKQFEGETLDLSNTYLVGLYFREFSLGIASELAKWDNWRLRGGIRFNYYQGLSGVARKQNKFYFTTAVGAEYINMDYDFEYQYTGVDDFNFFDTRGHGFGLNLGASFSYKDDLNFDIGVSDIGSIKFTKKIYKVGTKNTFQFKGLGLEEVLNPTAFLDSLEQVFTPEIDSLGENSFSMPIGTRFSFMTSWVFGRTTKINGPKTLSLLYTQGFSEHPGVTVNPKFTVGIHRPVYRHLLIGASASWGGFNNFALGGILGVHFKHFRFSAQSDDFTGLLFPDYGTGGGGGFVFQLLF
jgi:hypothetical protein